jgi:peptidoglycan hydrolase CwlO-like protein
MTSRVKIRSNIKKFKEQPKKIKPTIKQQDAVLAERMSKYFLLSK